MLAACAGAQTGESAQDIVGGAVDTGDPAVVAVAHRRIACGDVPAVTCSGVLIAPRVVLTAAHCVTGIAPRGALEVVFGADVAAPAAVVVVADAQLDAAYDAASGDHDLAALLLAEDAPVAPYPRPTASAADVADGGPLRAVGFGVTAPSAADLGMKRDGVLARGAVRAASFDAAPSPAMTCTGDSGGPVFATIGSGEQLVGVTSRGDAACAASAVNARVDAALGSFIDPFVGASTSAPPGWPSGVPLSDAPCASDAECPALMTCTAQQRCGFAWLGPGRFGGACTSDGACGPSARCARVWPTGTDACHCFSAELPPGADAGTTQADPPGGCGCGAGGTGSPVPAAILLALVLAFAGRKRRA